MHRAYKDQKQKCSRYSSVLNAWTLWDTSSVHGPADNCPKPGSATAAPRQSADCTRQFCRPKLARSKFYKLIHVPTHFCWPLQGFLMPDSDHTGFWEGLFALAQHRWAWPSFILLQMHLRTFVSWVFLFIKASESFRTAQECSVFWAAHFSLQTEGKIMLKIQWSLGNSTWKQLSNSLANRELKLHTYLSCHLKNIIESDSVTVGRDTLNIPLNLWIKGWEC